MLLMTGRSQLFRDSYEVEIGFNYISGLAPNAPVHFAGHEVGKVTGLRLLDEKGAASMAEHVVAPPVRVPAEGGWTGKSPEVVRPEVGAPPEARPGQAEAAPAPVAEPVPPLGRVVVTLRIDQTAVVKKDSQAYIDVMGFMGEKFIELTPGTAAAAPLGADDILRGSDPLAFYELVNMGTDVADKFKETTASLQTLIHDLDHAVGDNRPELDGIVANLNETSSNLKEMTEDLKWHPWKLLRKGKERSAEDVAREKEKKARKEKNV